MFKCYTITFFRYVLILAGYIVFSYTYTSSMMSCYRIFMGKCLIDSRNPCTLLQDVFPLLFDKRDRNKIDQCLRLHGLLNYPQKYILLFRFFPYYVNSFEASLLVRKLSELIVLHGFFLFIVPIYFLSFLLFSLFLRSDNNFYGYFLYNSSILRF